MVPCDPQWVHQGSAEMELIQVVHAGHVVMIVDGALDVRSKADVNTPIYQSDLITFFQTGTGGIYSLIFDVQAAYDILSGRYVLYGTDRTIVPGSIQSSMLFAVSKTSDVTSGWNFMAVNSTGPYYSANNSVPDSVFIGFTDDAITATSLITVPLLGTNASDFVGAYRGLYTAFYNFPKNVSNGPSVYEATIPHGITGIHYTRFDFVADIGAVAAGIPTPVRQVVASAEQRKYQKFIVGYGFGYSAADGGSLLLVLADNTTQNAGTAVAVTQDVPFPPGFISPEAFGGGEENKLAAQPQPMNQSKYQQTFGSNQELDAGFPAAIYQATLQDDRIFFATHILTGPVDPVTMQNTSVTKWAVLNIANISIQYIGNKRQLQGAFVESTGVLDAPLTSLINNYYPALTVNSANVAGKTFALIILSFVLPLLFCTLTLLVPSMSEAHL